MEARSIVSLCAILFPIECFFSVSLCASGWSEQQQGGVCRPSECISRKLYSNDHIPAFPIIQCNRFRVDGYRFACWQKLLILQFQIVSNRAFTRRLHYHLFSPRFTGGLEWILLVVVVTDLFLYIILSIMGVCRYVRWTWSLYVLTCNPLSHATLPGVGWTQHSAVHVEFTGI